jgi:hypothetical protein
MSNLLVHEIDELIGVLQEELDSTRAHLTRIKPTSRRETRRHQAMLARTLQRLASLQTLRNTYSTRAMTPR